MISLKTKEIEKIIGPNKTRNIDLIFVIDKSFSMTKDNKFEKVKEALNYIIDNREENDQLSLIFFDHGSETLKKLKTNMTNEELKTEINKIDIQYGAGSLMN